MPARHAAGDAERAPSRSRDRPPPRRTRRTAASPRARDRSTPERSVTEPPSAANAYGTAMRMTCARNASVRIVAITATSSRAAPRGRAPRPRARRRPAASRSAPSARGRRRRARPTDRKPSSSDASATPTGCERPSSAAEMPRRPVPRPRPSSNACLWPITKFVAARPASAPAPVIASDLHAADGDADRARRLGIAADREPRLAPRRARAQPPHDARPRRARCTMRRVRGAAAEPSCGSCAPGAIGAPVRRAALEQQRVADPQRDARDDRVEHDRRDHLVRAARARAARRSARRSRHRRRPPRACTPGSRSIAGVPAGSAVPTSAHANTPAPSCASPPMLNRPASSAIETASPVSASAVAL